MKRVEMVADPRQVDAFAEELRHERAMLAIHDRIDRMVINAHISIGVRMWLAERAIEARLRGASKSSLAVDGALVHGLIDALIAQLKSRPVLTRGGAAPTGAGTIKFRRYVPFERDAQTT